MINHTLQRDLMHKVWEHNCELIKANRDLQELVAMKDARILALQKLLGEATEHMRRTENINDRLRRKGGKV